MTVTRRTFSIASLLAPAAVLVLSVAAAVLAVDMRPPGDAAAYHARALQASRTLDLVVEDPTLGGTWAGRDTPVPYEATDLLRPNVLLSRQYTLQRYGRPTGETVGLLLVQCRDARDLLNHYPPICYKVGGWEVVGAEDVTWQTGPNLPPAGGVEYGLALSGFDHFQNRAISNFMVLPGEGFGRDMTGVERVSDDPARRYYGAAQVQVIFDASTTPPAERRRLTELFVRHCAPVLREIVAGPEGAGDGQM